MRIVYITGAKYPSLAANSVQVMKMCSGLAAHGHNVTLFAACEKRISVASLLEQYGILNDFEVVMANRKEIKIIGAIFYAISQVKAVWKRISSVDVIYGRDQNTLLLLSYLGRPIVYEAHAEPRGLKIAIERMIFRGPSFKLLVVISQALKEFYLDKYSFLSDSQVFVAHDGADPIEIGNLVDDRVLIDQNGRLAVGYTGHLYKGKGVEIIVKLARELPEVDFHIVGGNVQDVQLWKEKHDYPNLVYHGHVRNSLIPSYLLQFDILVLPAQRSVLGSGGGEIAKYMSPLKLFEYMSSGTPIVSSDLPVLREVLTDSVNALLVPPDSIPGWRNAINRLKNNRELRLRLAENARVDFESKYTWERRAANVVEHLCE